MKQGVSLICSEDIAGCGVSLAESNDFISSVSDSDLREDAPASSLEQNVDSSLFDEME